MTPRRRSTVTPGISPRSPSPPRHSFVCKHAKARISGMKTTSQSFTMARLRFLLVSLLLLISSAKSDSLDVSVVTSPSQAWLDHEPALQLAQSHFLSSVSDDSFQRRWTQCSSDASLHVRVSISVDEETRSRPPTYSDRLPEGFLINPDLGMKLGAENERLHISVRGQSVLGATYALYHMAERCQLQPCACWGEKSHELEASFTLRTLSEEGQLLDLPDIAYRTDQGPDYLNSSLVQQECDRLLQLVPSMMQHRFNSLTILHHDMEEYVDYTYLEGVQVYSDTDPHRNRSKALSAIINDFVHKLQAYHLTVFFQPYEVSCPPQLCDKLKLYAGSADLQRVLIARYKEFFEKVDADGIIVTVSGELHVVYNVCCSKYALMTHHIEERVQFHNYTSDIIMTCFMVGCYASQTY